MPPAITVLLRSPPTASKRRRRCDWRRKERRREAWAPPWCRRGRTIERAAAAEAAATSTEEVPSTPREPREREHNLKWNTLPCYSDLLFLPSNFLNTIIVQSHTLRIRRKLMSLKNWRGKEEIFEGLGMNRERGKGWEAFIVGGARGASEGASERGAHELWGALFVCLLTVHLVNLVIKNVLIWSGILV